MRTILCVFAAFAFYGPVAFGQTVTLSLNSSQDGRRVTAGTTIDWTITVEVSTGDNAGLALIATDLVQDVTNPAMLDILPGDVGSIDATMANFSRPDGISNAGEGGATTGYIGVQRGTSGSLFLKQIGGGQNTFGAAGVSIGLDPNVIAGVGQSGPQVVLSGSFVAPAAGGNYTFRLANASANVLDAANAAPTPSPVSSASVDATTHGFITFTVGDQLGDMNCDSSVNEDDVPAFVLALLDPSAYAVAHPGCDPMQGDYTTDGVLNGLDISGFVDELTGP